jgi:23S rRNA (guanosine2251-2'-O)-methyltransferase
MSRAPRNSRPERDAPPARRRAEGGDGGPRGSRRDGPGSKGGGGGLWFHGRHPIEAALANPLRDVLRLVALPGAADDLGQDRLPVETVDRKTLESLLPADAVHQGLALKTRPLVQPDVDEVARPAGPGLIAILDQVSDPHNVGAILRSAAAFGLRAVIVQDRHSPEETGTLAKSASGALERMPLIRVANLSQALDSLKDHGFWSAGMDARAEVTLRDSGLPDRRVVVLGSEGAGLRRLVRDHCDMLVKLPMSGAVESLNVSNAAAVAFYELAGRGMAIDGADPD